MGRGICSRTDILATEGRLKMDSRQVLDVAFHLISFHQIPPFREACFELK